MSSWQEATHFFDWLPEVSGSTLRADFTAAVTVAVLVVPQGVAFAAIAGMPPQYGLYAAMVPTIIAALFGSSRYLVSGPTTAASIVIYSALSGLAAPGTPEYVTLAITLTFLVGLVQLLLGLARMGMFVNFISHSVILGFTAGAALLIATSQIRHFFGIDVPRKLNILERLSLFTDKVDEVNIYAVMVGSLTLVAGLALRRLDRRIPYMLIALVAGSLLAILFTRVLGSGQTRIDFVGALPAALPAFTTPDLSVTILKELAPAVLALFTDTGHADCLCYRLALAGQHFDLPQLGDYLLRGNVFLGMSISCVLRVIVSHTG
jgi:SulP family sulfate permease